MLSVVPNVSFIWLCGLVKHFLCEAYVTSSVSSLLCSSQLASVEFFFYYSWVPSHLLFKDVCMYVCEAQGAKHAYKHIKYMQMQTCKHTLHTYWLMCVNTNTSSLRALIRQTVECISVWSFEEKTWKQLLCLEQRFVWCCRSTWLRRALAVVVCFKAAIK